VRRRAEVKRERNDFVQSYSHSKNFIAPRLAMNRIMARRSNLFQDQAICKQSALIVRACTEIFHRSERWGL
jgi:hypothetical protein